VRVSVTASASRYNYTPLGKHGNGAGGWKKGNQFEQGGGTNGLQGEAGDEANRGTALLMEGEETDCGARKTSGKHSCLLARSLAEQQQQQQQQQGFGGSNTSSTSSTSSTSHKGRPEEDLDAIERSLLEGRGGRASGLRSALTVSRYPADEAPSLLRQREGLNSTVAPRTISTTDSCSSLHLPGLQGWGRGGVMRGEGAATEPRSSSLAKAGKEVGIELSEVCSPGCRRTDGGERDEQQWGSKEGVARKCETGEGKDESRPTSAAAAAAAAAAADEGCCRSKGGWRRGAEGEEGWEQVDIEDGKLGREAGGVDIEGDKGRAEERFNEAWDEEIEKVLQDEEELVIVWYKNPQVSVLARIHMCPSVGESMCVGVCVCLRWEGALLFVCVCTLVCVHVHVCMCQAVHRAQSVYMCERMSKL